MNKTDVVSAKYAMDWMTDFELFQEALQTETSYVGNLANSMSLALEEFYTNLSAVGVSALRGDGYDDLLVKLDEAAIEYETEYRVEYERLRSAKKEADDKAAEEKEPTKSSSNLIESAPMESESNIYLRHAGDPDESMSEEERDFEQEEERKEEDAFKAYVERHVQITNDRATKN